MSTPAITSPPVEQRQTSAWTLLPASKSARWTVEVIKPDAWLKLVADGTVIPPTGFQTASWIGAVYDHLAPRSRAKPLCIVMRCRLTGEIAALAGLLVQRERGVNIARFADLGVADYNAILTPTGSTLDPASARTLVSALARGLKGVDVLALDRVYPGPMALHPGALPASHSGNRLTVIDTADAFIRSRGKKYRKEVERCYRVLASVGDWSFERANTPAEIDTAFSTLDFQQAERHADKKTHYALRETRYAAFYRDVLTNPASKAHIFTLRCDTRIIATLLGVEHGDTFTMLRIANGGHSWRHISPGRLIVVEAMRYFCARNIKTFDMGIGDYAFKRGFGTQSVPLVDLVLATSVRGMPYAAGARIKGKLRANPRLRALVQTARAKFKRRFNFSMIRSVFWFTRS